MLYPEDNRDVSMTTTNGIQNLGSSRKKDESTLEPSQTGYDHNAQDDRSFVSYQSAADTSLNSSRNKYDGENASFISCVSRNDPENGLVAMSEYVSGDEQLPPSQIKEPDAGSSSGVHSISDDGFSSLTDIKRENKQPTECCDISIYDNVVTFDNPSRVSLLRAASQRSVTGDNAHCLAPRRRQSGLFKTCNACKPWM